jgi:hypothetical protein
MLKEYSSLVVSVSHKRTVASPAAVATHLPLAA